MGEHDLPEAHVALLCLDSEVSNRSAHTTGPCDCGGWIRFEKITPRHDPPESGIPPQTNMDPCEPTGVPCESTGEYMC